VVESELPRPAKYWRHLSSMRSTCLVGSTLVGPVTSIGYAITSATSGLVSKLSFPSALCSWSAEQPSELIGQPNASTPGWNLTISTLGTYSSQAAWLHVQGSFPAGLSDDLEDRSSRPLPGQPPRLDLIQLGQDRLNVRPSTSSQSSGDKEC
jgi:hypothetical protein